MVSTRKARTSIYRSGLLAATTLLALTVSAPAVAAPAEGTVLATGGATAIKDSYIVVLKDSAVTAGAVDRTARALASRNGGGIGRVYQHALRGFEVKLSERAARRLAADPSVASVTQNHTVSASDIQSPTPSWGLDRVDQRALPVDGSYTYPNVAPVVRAYVIDGGINLTHTEFAGRVVSGRDVFDNDDDATDCRGHGTHVAGTLGGSTFGVAKNVQLVAVRVLNCQGQGTAATVIAGVDWVTGDHDPGELAVANMSLGGLNGQRYEPEERAVARSIADGITYVIAAGNDNGADACQTSPAAVPEAITVGATGPNDARASFSNIGSCVDLFAPGVDITSAFIGSDTATRTASGTSMATPHVTGAAALILADHPTYTPAQVTAELLADATPGAVTNPGSGSPNRLAYVDAGTPADDFALAATPASGTIPAGGTVSATISGTVTRGTAQPVSLVAKGLPDGATASFNSAAIRSDGSSTLTITTSPRTPPANYTVTVVGTGTSAARAVLFRLTVNSLPGCAGANSTDNGLFANTVEVPITITGCAGAAARNSTVELHIDHDYVGDLDIDLYAPDGTRYFMLKRTGGDGDDVDYTFTMDLSAETADGTWKLYVNDSGPQGSGFFDSWAIDLDGAELPVPVCGGLSTGDVTIPDGGTVESPLTVSGCDRAPSATSYVEVRVVHTWSRDLSLHLIAPDGQAFLLQDINGQGVPNVFQAFIVNLSGKRVNGLWKLRVQDHFWSNEGKIDSWKLTL